MTHSFFSRRVPDQKEKLKGDERRFTSEHLVFDILKLQVDDLPDFFVARHARRDRQIRARVAAVLASTAREARLSTSPVSRDGASRYLEIPADERT